MWQKWPLMDGGRGWFVFGVLGFSQNQIEKLLTKDEAEQFYGAFGHIFSIYFP